MPSVNARRLTVMIAIIMCGLIVFSYLEMAHTCSVERVDLPIVALWRDDVGMVESDERPPFIRLAIWDDGTVVYAQSQDIWNHELCCGKLPTERIARLKAAIGESGIFSVSMTGHLVPDTPRDILMVNCSGRTKVLFWDEIDIPESGINAFPTTESIEFKRCWKTVGHLATLSLPLGGVSKEARFTVPVSWTELISGDATKETKGNANFPEFPDSPTTPSTSDSP